MTPQQIEPPDARKAEGTCNGLPYDTELVCVDGVAIHFWVGPTPPSPARLQALLATARQHRDIVGATYSLGSPVGFWAHATIGHAPTPNPNPHRA